MVRLCPKLALEWRSSMSRLCFFLRAWSAFSGIIRAVMLSNQELYSRKALKSPCHVSIPPLHLELPGMSLLPP